ncbi:MAG: GNAT family N-acetyltransferase [Caulobacteraceae bacterium]
MADEFHDRRDPESDSGRFELDEGGITSFADYRLAGDTLVIEHVETPPAARGTGAAGRLMTAILAQARATGVEIIPECAYAAAWMKRRRTADTA